MEWYLKYESDDLIVPNDRETLEALCAEDIPLSTVDWCHSGVTGSEKFRSPDKYRERSTKPTVEELDFDRQSPYVQVSKGCSIHEAEGSNSSAFGEPPFLDCCARTSEASSYGPDFQLPKSMDWMDEIFLNTLLEEDDRTMENPLESLNISDSVDRSVVFGNPVTNMLINPQSLMKDMIRKDTSMSACSFPTLTNDISEAWGKVEDGSPSCLMPEESKRSEGPATDPDQTLMLPVELSASNECEAVSDMDEPKCLEETVLQELEGTMIQLSEKTRICFRDALYRLAKTSKQQRTISQNRSANFIDRPLFAEVNGGSPSLGRSGCAESETNTIDRTIANLLFNLPYYCPPDLQWSTDNLASYGSYYSSEHQVPPHHYQGQVNYQDVSTYQFA